jgi:hypothetical protein
MTDAQRSMIAAALAILKQAGINMADLSALSKS